MKGLKKLVIIGDSLALPRPEDKISYEQTYPGMLAASLQQDFYIINRARRSNTTIKQVAPLHILDDLAAYSPDVLIIHLGIVDCAPRLFSIKQQKVIERLPGFLKNTIIKTASQNRQWLTKTFPKVYVDKSNFEQAYKQLIAACKQHAGKIICLGIAPTTQRNMERSHGYLKNIIAYNAIIEAICQQEGLYFVPSFELLSADVHLLKDGIHLNEKGANRISECVSQFIGVESGTAKRITNTL